MGDHRKMNLKKRLRQLCFAALLFLGSLFLLSRWSEKNEILTALPPEEQQMLEKSPQFTLYSLLSHPEPEELKTRSTFHDNLILGQTQVISAKTRTDLLTAFYEGLDKGYAMACFNPRHGIRVVQNNKTVDLVICFECQQVEIYDSQGKRTITISDSPKSVFDHVLSEAKV